MSSKFVTETSVVQVEQGLYQGRVSRDWWVQRGPNGGYVAAMLVRALTAAVGDEQRTPRSLTIHYAAAPQEGPVRIATTVERTGRSLTTLTARLEQDGRLVALGLAAFSRSRDGALEFAQAAMPEAVPPEDTEVFPKGAPFPPFASNWDMHFGIGTLPFAGAHEAFSGGWIRPAERQGWDYALIAQLTDAWFPAVFTRLDGPNGVPTIDLTIHFRAELPLPDLNPGDFALVAFRSRVAAGGFVEEDGEIWSRDGTLIAQSRQLALLQAPSQR